VLAAVQLAGRRLQDRKVHLCDRLELWKHNILIAYVLGHDAYVPYPLHDRAATVTTCGRICFNRQKINLSQVFAGQTVGIKQTDDRIWLVSFMDYDLGYFDDETCRLEPLANPFGPKVLPMSSE